MTLDLYQFERSNLMYIRTTGVAFMNLGIAGSLDARLTIALDIATEQTYRSFSLEMQPVFDASSARQTGNVISGVAASLLNVAGGAEGALGGAVVNAISQSSKRGSSAGWGWFRLKGPKEIRDFHSAQSFLVRGDAGVTLVLATPWEDGALKRFPSFDLGERFRSGGSDFNNLLVSVSSASGFHGLLTQRHRGNFASRMFDAIPKTISDSAKSKIEFDTFSGGSYWASHR